MEETENVCEHIAAYLRHNGIRDARRLNKIPISKHKSKSITLSQNKKLSTSKLNDLLSNTLGRGN